MDGSSIPFFWSRVHPEPNSGCWIWSGATHRKRWGYGLIRGYKSRPNWYAHRLSYRIHHGPIPDGADVMHSCDNRLCVNPDHLSVGSRAQNMRDAQTRNRTTKGTRNSNSKLYNARIVQIRKRYSANPNLTFRELGRMYGVSADTVWKIVRGKRWAHVGGPVHSERMRRPKEPR